MRFTSSFTLLAFASVALVSATPVEKRTPRGGTYFPYHGNEVEADGNEKRAPRGGTFFPYHGNEAEAEGQA